MPGMSLRQGDPPGRRPGRVAIGAVAALLAVAGVTACGGSGTSSATRSETSATTKTQSSATSATSTVLSATESAVLATHYRELEGAMSAYASCMRAHGIDFAPPRRTAQGAPALGVPRNTSTTSPLFEAGLRACRSQIVRVLHLSG